MLRMKRLVNFLQGLFLVFVLAVPLSVGWSIVECRYGSRQG
jgi:hypothetical protein